MKPLDIEESQHTETDQVKTSTASAVQGAIHTHKHCCLAKEACTKPLKKINENPYDKAAYSSMHHFDSNREEKIERRGSYARMDSLELRKKRL